MSTTARLSIPTPLSGTTRRRRAAKRRPRAVSISGTFSSRGDQVCYALSATTSSSQRGRSLCTYIPLGERLVGHASAAKRSVQWGTHHRSEINARAFGQRSDGAARARMRERCKQQRARVSAAPHN